MRSRFSQPIGNVSKEPNKQAIARIFGIKQSEIAYLKAGVEVTSYKILYDKESQLCFWRNSAIGTISTWSISGTTLTIVTSSGTFSLIQAIAGDWLKNNNAFSLLGKCKTIAELRTLSPIQNGEQVLVERYYADSPQAGGGVFAYDASIDDSTVNAKDLNVIVFRTTAGKYYKRVKITSVTPYHAGAYGNGTTDDTVAFQAAIKAAESTPLFFTGNTIVGSLGRFESNVTGCKNQYLITGTIDIQPLLINTYMLGSVIDFRNASYGTESTPKKCLNFVNAIYAENHQVSYHQLPRILGVMDTTNHSYHVLVGFETRNDVNTGFRMHLFGGLLEGAWRGIVTATNHFYYCKFDTISVDHCSNYAFYGYIEKDSGEEVVIDNCKFYQSENIALFVNGIWNCRNTSFVYPYNGNIITNAAGFVNLDTCFLEGYQKMPGYMIYQKGGNYPCVLIHNNTHFAKIKSVVGETLVNPTPFYTAVGASIEGVGASFDKVFQNTDASSTIKLGTALSAGAGGKCTLKGTRIPSVLADENNAKYSFPPALVPSGNVTKNGYIDNAFMTSTNTSINQCGSYLGIAVFGQSGVVGAPAAPNVSSRTWVENSVQVASLVHNSDGLTYNVASSATDGQVYNLIIGVLPSSDLLAYLPQVTYTATADFVLTLYFVKTTQVFSNASIIDPTSIRVLSQPVAVSLPATTTVNTLPNIAPLQEGVAFGGIKGFDQASHVLMCIAPKTKGSTIVVKNASFVTI